MLTLPFSRENLTNILKKYNTPFYLYDEEGIRMRARLVYDAFSWVPDYRGKPGGYMNFFAVKALPNPNIIRILRQEHMGLDCSSYVELVIAERMNIPGSDVMLTSNNTPLIEFQKAAKMGACINFDDLSHISDCFASISVPERICLRYNPGPLRGGNAIIGKPEEAKYGFTKEHIMEGIILCKNMGVNIFGLHTMLASNELEEQYFIDTAVMMFDLVQEVYKQTGVKVSFVNLGGGIGIPYHPDDKNVNIRKIADGIHKAYKQQIMGTVIHPLVIYTENARVITGPYGYLVTRVRHIKDTYKKYVGVDATMADLMRPAIYGAYHHITVVGKETQPCSEVYDITGSLCENNDKFAIDRTLPLLERGDILVLHDVGAHGHAMGFNYNGKLRALELLLNKDKTVKLIRRAETVEDYMRTIMWD